MDTCGCQARPLFTQLLPAACMWQGDSPAKVSAPDTATAETLHDLLFILQTVQGHLLVPRATTLHPAAARSTATNDRRRLPLPQARHDCCHVAQASKLNSHVLLLTVTRSYTHSGSQQHCMHARALHAGIGCLCLLSARALLLSHTLSAEWSSTFTATSGFAATTSLVACSRLPAEAGLLPAATSSRTVWPLPNDCSSCCTLPDSAGHGCHKARQGGDAASSAIRGCRRYLLDASTTGHDWWLLMKMLVGKWTTGAGATERW
jgi:hypothetical protein